MVERLLAWSSLPRLSSPHPRVMDANASTFGGPRPFRVHRMIGVRIGDGSRGGTSEGNKSGPPPSGACLARAYACARGGALAVIIDPPSCCGNTMMAGAGADHSRVLASRASASRASASRVLAGLVPAARTLSASTCPLPHASLHPHHSQATDCARLGGGRR